MSTNTKNEKSVSGDSPVCGKSRGNRLARRARSFKEDFLEIISQMRSPGSSSTRSGSPSSPKTRPKGTDIVDHGTLEKNPSKDLEFNILQAQLALKHFRDVVNKNKLEMLPGNGTVVLDTISAIHVLLKKYVLNEQSSSLVSATNQVYQSLAKLIKLCDDYLLIGEKALGKENVTEIVNLVEDAIQNFVSLTKDKLILRDSSHKLGNEVSSNHVNHKPRLLSDKNNLDLGQRSSLPDIPLTPREREILERTSAFVLERHSQSSDNVLGDSPPPKPPHPDRVHLDPSYPPPLPPKKKHKHVDDVVVIKNSMECLSLRSKSPEDSSSLLSASAGSLDSVLSHCGEGELTDLVGQTEGGEIATNSFFVERNSFENGCPQHFYWSYGSSAVEPIQATNTLGVCDCTRDSPVLVPEAASQGNSPIKLDRFSGSQPESGFSSMPSGRSSCQSYSTSSQHLSSTRSSQQSYTSHDSLLTEKKLTSSSESAQSQKIQYLTVESNQTQSTPQKTVINSVSSEKLSYQKQAYFKGCADTSTGNETCRTSNDFPCKKLEEIPCCHHEIKLHECSFHASSLSYSSSEPFGTCKSASPNFGNSSISSDGDKPPALPEKIKSRMNRERHLSQYDNLDDAVRTLESTCEKNSTLFQTVIENGIISHKQNTKSAMNALKVNSFSGVRSMSQSDSIDGTSIESKSYGSTTEQTVQSLTCSVFESAESQYAEGKPPPLPPKKKHIMAYMEIFGNASHANANEFLRHSVHAYNLLQSEWQQHQKLITSAHSCSFALSYDSNQTTPVRTNESISGGLPPALPPKKRTRSTTSSPPQTPTLILTSDISKRDESKAGEQKNIQITELTESSSPENGSLPATTTAVSKDSTPVEPSTIDVEKDGEVSLLDRLNVSEYLVLKKEEEEGPDIRGGHPDALVIHATKAHKNDFLYQEAFLTTYRTFMTPLELIQKLCYRHQKFSSSQDSLKQRAARESFSLLVRVVSDLTLTDLDQVILQTLMEFVQQLLCRGDLTMAKALRVIMLSKYEAKKLYLNANNLLPSHNIYTRQSLLLDFKSEHIAEQMTLLDAELFLKIEIPEVLIWAQEQNEERSPNLTKFTEHFNKMSYWARSRILEQNDAKDREKYVLKFIKIMKHLRKINNFNSYLALLSALDSAPIRRLEWQKHITEGLKEYCALIDSSSSFRAYRQALAETNPPCIPYIGLVLQDLTFVHIGNMNTLPSGAINFSKRWQQFNIVENMKRFKKGSYTYKKNERIIAFFNGFDDSLSEEAMWQISEKIKPRGGKKN